VATVPDAQWDGILPSGDLNLDCRVNILDLIPIRNRLGQSAVSSGNWPADVNEDGWINVLDLIFVRNRLGGSCR